MGYLHEVRYGRASLALDLIEEFRSILADSVVLSLCNNRRLSLEDFNGSEGYPQLRREAWPKFLRAWEERLTEQRAGLTLSPLLPAAHTRVFGGGQQGVTRAALDLPGVGA